MAGYTKIAPLGNTEFALSKTNFAKLNDAIYQLKRVKLYASDYGVLADGTTDDTTAWQSCLSDVPAAGATVVVPIGTSLVPNGGLTCTNSVVFEGLAGTYAGISGSQIKMTAATGTLLALSGPASGLEGVVLFHLSTTTRNNGLIAVSFTNANFARIDKSQISGFYTDLKMDTGVYATISDSSIRDFVSTGIELRYTGQPDAGDLRVEGCTFDRTGSDASTGGKAIFATTMGGLFINDNKINGRAGANAFDDAIHFQVPDGLTSSLVMIQDNSMESARTGILIDRANVSGNISNSVVITGNEINGLNNAGSTGININGPQVPGLTIDDNNIVLANIGIDIGNCKHVSIGSGNSMYSITTTGIRIRDLCKDVEIARFPIDMVIGGKDLIVDAPYYTSVEYSFKVPFRDFNDTSLHDLFEIGTGLTGSGFASCIVDIDISGTVQGQGTFVRRLARAYTSNAAAADSNAPTVIGTDFTGVGAAFMSTTFTVAGLAGPVKFGITRGASGTTLDGTCWVKVKGNGLTHVKKLIRND